MSTTSAATSVTLRLESWLLRRNMANASSLVTWRLAIEHTHGHPDLAVATQRLHQVVGPVGGKMRALTSKEHWVASRVPCRTASSSKASVSRE